eukprot:5145479-Alexandrium_andersonii.AAC.1
MFQNLRFGRSRASRAPGGCLRAASPNTAHRAKGSLTRFGGRRGTRTRKATSTSSGFSAFVGQAAMASSGDAAR